MMRYVYVASLAWFAAKMPADMHYTIISTATGCSCAELDIGEVALILRINPHTKKPKQFELYLDSADKTSSVFFFRHRALLDRRIFVMAKDT
jgi:hypothetical protein